MYARPAAFLFGLPWWASALIIAAVLVVLFMLWISWPWAWVMERRHRHLDEEQEYELYGGPAPVTRGVLICDWVDTAVLSTVAQQKNVEPQPVRTEHGRTTMGSTSGQIGPRALRGKLGRDRQQEQRSYFEFEQDPNALLVEVLRKLKREHALEMDLDVVASPNPLSEEMLDNMLTIARERPELEAARDALRTFRDNSMREAKVEEFKRAASETKFVLIESEWRVTDENGDREFWLSLTKLRPPAYYDGTGSPDNAMGRYEYEGRARSNMEPVPMPDDLNLSVRLPADKFTDQGRGRLTDKSVVKAGVFGTTAQFTPSYSRLFITPIAVFARIES